MGLQALLDSSEEGGGQECLDPAARFFGFRLARPQGPHMGWNTVEWLRDHPSPPALHPAAYFYFVHSFYPTVEDRSLTLGETEYGVTFPSVLARDNVFATQFHPEKSGEDGLAIYRNFVDWARSDAFAHLTASALV
jgi:glutamine amidotransferase